MKPTKYSIINNAKIGLNARIYDQVNLYGCEIGKNTKIDSYVYIEEGVKVGDNCKIRPFVFIPTGVVIEDNAIAIGIPAKVVGYRPPPLQINGHKLPSKRIRR